MMAKKIIKWVAMAFSMAAGALIAVWFGGRAFILSIGMVTAFAVHMGIDREEEDMQLVEDVIDAMLAEMEDEEDERKDKNG